METKKEPKTNIVYDTLKEQIITTVLLPGQILMAQQLSEKYNISRTPVREALVKLKEEGLVQEASGNKFKVSPLTWKKIEDCYQAREIVETACFEYAALNATKNQIDSLVKICEKMDQVDDFTCCGEYYTLDLEFHMEACKILNNKILIDFMNKNADEQQRIRYCTGGLETNNVLSCAEHIQLVNAIENRDPDLARKLIIKHLRRAVDELKTFKEKRGIISFVSED